MANSDIIGKVGGNYKMKDCPFLIPKENMKFFSAMQQASNRSSVQGWHGAYLKNDIFSKPGITPST